MIISYQSDVETKNRVLIPARFIESGDHNTLGGLKK